MNIMVWTYLIYLAISVGITVWVAHTLHKNGRIFLVDRFLGNEKLADSVNHLLVVGFYLINIGFVSLALKYGDPATNVQEGIEYLSLKIGLVLLILGTMHFLNIFGFSQMRQKALRSRPADVLPVDARTTADPRHPLGRLHGARSLDEE